MSCYGKILVSMSVSLMCLLNMGVADANILSTKHNLSVSGPGSVRAVSEERVCIFCHIPHHATDVAPLWSRSNSNAIYNLYGSSSLVAQTGQPTGASRLCLSCHDGTIAVGMLAGAATSIPMSGGVTTMPFGLSNLETDLSDDHPISIAYNSSLVATKGELNDPHLLPVEIKLEDGEVLQCTSCHNPHKNPHGMFLVMSNTGSALCISCHDKTGWTQSSHATDVAVADQACESCHQNHGAPGAKHLLQNLAEEANCLSSCHNGSGPGKNIQVESTKFYNHPFDFAAGVHDVSEDPLVMGKHVECVDCHDPHHVNSTATPLASAPAVNGRMTGVKGVDKFGGVVSDAENEYEICFGCHANTAFAVADQVPRMIQESNERLRFDESNPSYHPVTAIGVNPNVPSLNALYTTYTETSQIYCSDCHGSDSSAKAGGSGTGADGPHGSLYPHILIGRYDQDYPQVYSLASYALCFRCHDPDALFNPFISTFGNSHKSHVQMKDVPCSACHDPHGVPAVRGATTVANAHLINFDVRYAVSAAVPVPAYDAVAGTCLVACHNNLSHTH